MVSWVKRILSIDRAGHSGTLDPKVTGVLPVMLGNATKIANTLLTAGKEYVCVMRLHQEELEDKIQKAAAEFVGTIYQRPPVRSSVKRRVRTRRIYYLTILETDGKNVLFRVGCQAGTYIRKLCVAPSSFIFLNNGGAKEISSFVDSSLVADNSNLFQRKVMETISFDTENHSFVSSSITGVQRLPAPEEMLKISLSSGISITVTPDHELLIDNVNKPTWVEAQEIVSGHHFFAPRKLVLKSTASLYLVDWLDLDVLCVGEELKEICRYHLAKRFGSVTSACRALKIDRRALFKKNSGIRIKYLHRICDNTDLDWFSVREKIEQFKGERGARYLITENTLNETLLYLLGLIASDGCVVQEKRCVRPTRVIFANMEKALVQKFKQIINQIFPSTNVKSKTTESGLIRLRVNNPILAGLAKSLGITSPKATMRLEKLASLPEKLISRFLAGYFDGDGTVSIKPNSMHTEIAYDTAHQSVAQQLFLLLKRIGIRSRIFERIGPTFDKKNLTLNFHIVISTPSDKKQFIQTIRCNHPRKKQRLNQFKGRFKRYGSYGSSDLMPLYCVELIKSLMQKYQLSKNSVYKGGTFDRILSGKRPTRLVLSKCVKSLTNLIPNGDLDLLKLKQIQLADFFLEEVKSVEKVIPDFKYVYDITVDLHHNFILNGAVVVSNCFDIGEVLGGGSHMAELRRTRTGAFKEDATLVSLYDVKDAYHFWQEDKEERFLRQYIQPLETGVQHLAHIIIRDTAVDAICHGANLAATGVLQLHSDIKPGDYVAIKTLKGELVALAIAQQTSQQILEATSGIVANTKRVVIPTGTYPSAWQRKSKG